MPQYQIAMPDKITTAQVHAALELLGLPSRGVGLRSVEIGVREVKVTYNAKDSEGRLIGEVTWRVDIHPSSFFCSRPGCDSVAHPIGHPHEGGE